MPRKKDESRYREAAHLYSLGQSAVTVGAQLGMSPPTVLKAVRHMGGTVRSSAQHAGSAALECITARNQNIAKAYQAGLACADIGREHGISRERVRQILAKMGFQGVGWGARSHANAQHRRAEIKRRWDAGESTAQIAKTLGIHVTTVRNGLAAFGIREKRFPKVTARTLRAIEMFQAGASFDEITERLGYTNKACCTAVLHRYGWTEQRRQMLAQATGLATKYSARLDEIADRLIDDMTAAELREIAKKLREEA